MDDVGYRAIQAARYAIRESLRTAGKNGPLPPHLRIEHWANPLDDGSGRVTAYDDDNDDPWTRKQGVAGLSWDSEGQIDRAEVYDDRYKRRGIATQLLNHVRDNIRPDIHPGYELSDEGQAWAESDPNYVPELPPRSYPGLPRHAMLRLAERAELEWRRSLGNGDWELTTRTPSGVTKTVDISEHPQMMYYSSILHEAQQAVFGRKKAQLYIDDSPYYSAAWDEDLDEDEELEEQAAHHKHRRHAMADAAFGDCYQAAGRYMLDHTDNPNLQLVHGEVAGQGPLEGKIFGHAWVEDGDNVIDRSNGRDIQMPKALYYHIGKINQINHYYKYDHENAAINMLRNKHWGPWDWDGETRDWEEKTAALHKQAGWDDEALEQFEHHGGACQGNAVQSAEENWESDPDMPPIVDERGRYRDEAYDGTRQWAANYLKGGDVDCICGHGMECHHAPGEHYASRHVHAIEISDEDWEKLKASLESGKVKAQLGPPEKVKYQDEEDDSEPFDLDDDDEPNEETFGTGWADALRQEIDKLMGRPEHEGWFHASTQDLPVGTKLIPGGAGHASGDFYDQMGFGKDTGTLMDMGGGREEHVWLTPYQDDAHFWAAVNNAPHIYEVEPDDDPRPWNGTGTDGWVVPSATIKRKISGPEQDSDKTAAIRKAHNVIRMAMEATDGI